MTIGAKQVMLDIELPRTFFVTKMHKLDSLNSLSPVSFFLGVCRGI
jgi:hypothetical protein